MSQPADIIIINTKVFTSNESNPRAEAVAVKGNRIVFVGSNEGTEALRGEKTRVIDGQGRTLTPGFIDTHVHLLWGSIWMASAQLQEVKNKTDLKNVMLDFASKNQTDEWLTGRGIKYAIVSTRHELDEIVADRPMYIGAYDGHTGWANTKALEMAGILTDDGRELINDIIVRDENGLATGELREGDAMNAVMNLVPLPDGRALISFDAPFTPAEFELMIADALDDRRLSRSDQAIFRGIAEILRAARRSKDVTLRQRNIIVLDSRRHPRPATSKRSASRAPQSEVPA